jgi:hypothetical protein
MTFRQIVGLIDQWKEIEKNREMLKVFLANGGNPNEVGISAEEVRQKEASMGEAMW